VQVGSEGGGAFFTGEYLHSLDPKKRLTIPSEWREMVGEPRKFYVLPAVESKCVSLYRVPDFMRKLSRLKEHSIADPKARQMARILGSRSAFLGWDSAGRIRIKDDLLAGAGLEHKVVLLGALDRIELWNPDDWRKAGAEGDAASLEEAVRYVNL
jgi:MraZ protein